MSRFITSFNYDPQINKGDKNDLPSETIQGQSLSVTEVLIRFSRGTLPNIQFPTYYDEIEDFDADDPTLRPDFDLSDTDNILEFIEDKHKEIETETPVDGTAVLHHPSNPSTEGV